MKPLLFLTGFLLYGVSLSGQPEETFVKGQIIDTVECLKKAGHSYALYLPEAYHTGERWPILYIFDPASRGAYALQQFQPAAEQFNFILACSNNSRNGSWDDVFEAADAVFVDTQERLAVNYERVYLSGFSGGSRAALAMAVLTPQIAGLIGCGAALPPVKAYQPTKETARFLYVGMVGLRDMNYLEHLDAAHRFDALGLDNYLIHFEAGHKWPAPDEIILAVHWLEIKHRQSRGAHVAELLSGFQERVLEKARFLYQDGYPLTAASMLEHYRQDFPHPKFSGAPVDSLLGRIIQDRAYRKALIRHKKANRRERELKDKYLAAFVELYLTAPPAGLPQERLQWWQGEVARLRKWAESKDKVKSNSAFRLLNLLSARSAESCSRYLSEGQIGLALALNRIWLEASPDEVSAHWHMAKVQALMGRKMEAINYLERAYEKGMQYRRSLMVAAFEGLRHQARFQELLRKMEEREAARSKPVEKH